MNSLLWPQLMRAYHRSTLLQVHSSYCLAFRLQTNMQCCKGSGLVPEIVRTVVKKGLLFLSALFAKGLLQVLNFCRPLFNQNDLVWRARKDCSNYRTVIGLLIHIADVLLMDYVCRVCYIWIGNELSEYFSVGLPTLHCGQTLHKSQKSKDDDNVRLSFDALVQQVVLVTGDDVCPLVTNQSRIVEFSHAVIGLEFLEFECRTLKMG